MSLRLAIAQITAPNWWNEPSEPRKSNAKKRNETAEQRKLLLASILRKRTPKTMAELAAENDCTVAKIRSLVDPYLKSGALVRSVNAENKVTISKGTAVLCGF